MMGGMARDGEGNAVSRRRVRVAAPWVRIQMSNSPGVASNSQVFAYRSSLKGLRLQGFAYKAWRIRRSRTHHRDFAADMREFCREPPALRKKRAQGVPGAGPPRSLAWSVKNTRVSPHGHAGNHPAFPAQWF